MPGADDAPNRVLPRSLLRGFLLVWVGLIDLWVLGTLLFNQPGCPASSPGCAQKLADTPTPPDSAQPLAFPSVLGLILVSLGLLAGAVSERVPVRWRWSYFLAQGALVFAIGDLTGQGLVVANLSLAFALEALLALKQVRSIAILGGGYFLLTVLWWLLSSWGKVSSWQSVFALLNGDPLFLSLLLFGGGYLLLYVWQVRAHAQLEDAHQQLRAAAARIEALTRLAERQRMARELHDTLAQGLAGTMMQLQAADARLTHQRYPEAQEAIHQAMAEVRTALAEARSAIADLRTMPESVSDLQEAVQSVVQRFTAATGLACTVALDGIKQIPASRYEPVQRVITEGLSNVARHAQATQVTIRGQCKDSSYILAITDDGTGFDPAEAFTQTGHFGLVGLRERARLASGYLEIESAPQQGTTLRCFLPLEASAHSPLVLERNRGH
jgi:NarL family two-component system sensor histidine kinase YdfH